MSKIDLQNITVLNYNENEVFVDSSKEHYKFNASGDGVTPTMQNIPISELQYICSNTDVIVTGWLTFDEDEKEEVYRPCSSDERDYIQFCIHRALNEFENPIVEVREIPRGFTNKVKTIEVRKYKRYSVNDINPNRLSFFTSFVIELIQEKYPNILKYYSCYQIRFNEYSCNYYIERHDIDSEGKDVNEKVVNELLRMFRRNQEKALNDNVPETYKKFSEVRKNIIHYEKLIDLTIMTKK